MPHPESRQFFIEPLSPLVLRSGRPFGTDGLTGATTGTTQLLPGTAAGTLRAAWCTANGYQPTDQDSHIDRLHLHGPLPMTWQAPRGQHPGLATLWLTPPANARAAGLGRQAVALRPTAPPADTGCDLPFGMLPVLADSGTDRRLDDPPPCLWSLQAVADWLHASPPHRMTNPPWAADSGGCLPLPPDEEQVHIRTNASRQVEAGAFFVNQAVDHSLPMGLLGRFDARGLWMRAEVPSAASRLPPADPGTVGAVENGGPLARAGYRQLPAQTLLRRFDAVVGQPWRLGADGATAQVHALGSELPDLLAPLRRLNEDLSLLARGDALCLLLATPGCFGRNGWYPWLLRDQAPEADGAPRPRINRDAVPEGRLPGWPPGWRFQLRSALVGSVVPQGSLKARSNQETTRPLSGYRPKNTDAAADPAAGLGRLQWLVPAGSLYWFEVIAVGEPIDPSLLQLRSCAEVQFARDGHALALYAKAARLPPRPDADT